MKQQLPKILVVCGPTASGKSSLALELAKEFDGEIVTADSQQLFADMVIGTNSPTEDEKKKIPHHLCNMLPAAETYNAAKFKIAAEKVIGEILERGKLPILVGGTGLYIKTIVDNFDFAETKPNATLREALEAKTLEQLVEELEDVNGVKLSAEEKKNKRRVIRALEIAASGKNNKGTNAPKFDVLQIAPAIDREDLYKHINARVLAMLKNGLEAEVKNLVQKYSWDTQALSGIGYREFRPYFEGSISLDSVVTEIQKDTRRYAKRQLTWFKADSRVRWVKNPAEAKALVKSFLK